jgi:hypothetical protein
MYYPFRPGNLARTLYSILVVVELKSTGAGRSSKRQRKPRAKGKEQEGDMLRSDTKGNINSLLLYSFESLFFYLEPVRNRPDSIATTGQGPLISYK